MRPGQNKRMRGRNNNNNNRKGPNPLTRSYESNGPDVKIRGTAHHIGEKYLQLARDAHSSGDPVRAESYLQHAEHYFRVIAAAQQAQQAQHGYGRPFGDAVDLDDDDDGDDSMPDRFASPSERQGQPSFGERPPFQGQQNQHHNAHQQGGQHQGNQHQGNQGAQGQGGERGGQNERGYDNRNGRNYDNRSGQDRAHQDRGHQDRSHQDRGYQDRGHQDRNYQGGSQGSIQGNVQASTQGSGYGGNAHAGAAQGHAAQNGQTGVIQTGNGFAGNGHAGGGQGGHHDRSGARGDGGQQDRQPRQEMSGRDQPRDFDNRQRTPRPPRPAVEQRQPPAEEPANVGLPAFITGPTRAVAEPAAPQPDGAYPSAEGGIDHRGPQAEAGEESVHLRPRRRRRPKADFGDKADFNDKGDFGGEARQDGHPMATTASDPVGD